jgi:hypothetical protein
MLAWLGGKKKLLDASKNKNRPVRDLGKASSAPKRKRMEQVDNQICPPKLKHRSNQAHNNQTPSSFDILLCNGADHADDQHLEEHPESSTSSSRHPAAAARRDTAGQGLITTPGRPQACSANFHVHSTSKTQPTATAPASHAASLDLMLLAGMAPAQR